MRCKPNRRIGCKTPIPILCMKMTPTEIATKEEALASIRDTIEKLSKRQHIQVLQILQKYPSIRLNENRNGVYINLTYIPDEAVEELSKYILYVNDQEKNLETVELQKEEFQRAFFTGNLGSP